MTWTMVNGHDAPTGCYIEGHRGQYGPDHLAYVAESFGWVSDPSERPDPRAWRAAAESDANDSPDTVCDSWERYRDAADRIEAWLNEHTADGFVWHWHDGEFFLSPMCEDGNCDDDTCAHWEG